MSYNSGNVNSTITGDIKFETTPNLLGALTSVVGNQSGAGTATMGTVGASKIWYIISFTHHLSYATAGGESQIRFNGVAHSNLYVGVADHNIAIAQRWGIESCPKLTAGQTITLVNSNSGARASVQYIEVDA